MSLISIVFIRLKMVTGRMVACRILVTQSAFARIDCGFRHVLWRLKTGCIRASPLQREYKSSAYHFGPVRVRISLQHYRFMQLWLTRKILLKLRFPPPKPLFKCLQLLQLMLRILSKIQRLCRYKLLLICSSDCFSFSPAGLRPFAFPSTWPLYSLPRLC